MFRLFGHSRLPVSFLNYNVRTGDISMLSSGTLNTMESLPFELDISYLKLSILFYFSRSIVFSAIKWGLLCKF